MNFILPTLLLLGGFLILVKGADFFVDGASSIAKHFKVSSLVIGLTVVAFGTSLPEAAVSISSAIKGSGDISFGNVIGSNIFNLLLILGISSIIIPQVVHKDLIKRDLPVAIFSVLLLIPMYYLLGTQNVITRLEGLLLTILVISFVVMLIKKPNTEIKLDEKKEIEMTYPIKKAIIITIIGAIGIALGGILVTNGAKEIALLLGMSELLVGLTIISIGTSLPELVTSIVAASKKESDIAIGNIIGSNIFNVLFILGFSALITPISFNQTAIFDIIFVSIATIIVYLFALRRKQITRLHGIILLVLYFGYMFFIINRDLSQANVISLFINYM
ncbi:calcium/sodium antiporter [Haploplasma modicum]|uniref:calcium/sodium antiporter n=1 Tax=Haploplasma modicum TaxID=2150 RepID=UPI00068FC2A0|nr:calcium/sodium antiporter [Haploplasma modicum]